MKKNQLKLGVLLSYASMGIGYAVSLGYTPVMLRLLGKSEYGLYSLVASVVAFLGVLNFGFGSTYTRYYLRYKVKNDQEGIARLNGMFLLIFCFIGLITILASGVMAFNAKLVFGTQLTARELETAKILLLILTANLAVSFPGIVFSSHITANEQFVFQNLVNMLKTVFNPFISLPLLLMGYGSIGLATATVVVSLLVEISNIIFCLRRLKMRFRFGHFEPGLLKSVTRFSFFIFINLVIDQINWSVDKFILGRYHGTAVVAVYGVAAQIGIYYRSISSAISNVFIPRVHKLVASGQEAVLTALFTKIGRIQFAVMAMLALGIVLYGKPFFLLWAGPEYGDSYAIALLLILPVTIPLIQSIGIEIQRAKNMHRFRSLVYFGIALLNTLLTLWLARQYQGVGAAIGTAAAMLLGNGLIINWYNHVRVGLDMGYFWKQIGTMLPGLVPPVVVSWLFGLAWPATNWFSLLVHGLLYVLVYVASMWLLGFNTEEKRMISQPLRRFRRRKSGNSAPS